MTLKSSWPSSSRSFSSDLLVHPCGIHTVVVGHYILVLSFTGLVSTGDCDYVVCVHVKAFHGVTGEVPPVLVAKVPSAPRPWRVDSVVTCLWYP